MATYQLCVNSPLPDFKSLRDSIRDILEIPPLELPKLPRPFLSIPQFALPTIPDPIFPSFSSWEMEWDRIVSELQNFQLANALLGLFEPVLSFLGLSLDSIIPKIPYLGISLVDLVSGNFDTKAILSKMRELGKAELGALMSLVGLELPTSFDGFIEDLEEQMKEKKRQFTATLDNLQKGLEAGTDLAREKLKGAATFLENFDIKESISGILPENIAISLSDGDLQSLFELLVRGHFGVCTNILFGLVNDVADELEVTKLSMPTVPTMKGFVEAYIKPLLDQFLTSMKGQLDDAKESIETGLGDLEKNLNATSDLAREKLKKLEGISLADIQNLKSLGRDKVNAFFEQILGISIPGFDFSKLLDIPFYNHLSLPDIEFKEIIKNLYSNLLTAPFQIILDFIEDKLQLSVSIPLLCVPVTIPSIQSLALPNLPAFPEIPSIA